MEWRGSGFAEESLRIGSLTDMQSNRSDSSLVGESNLGWGGGARYREGARGGGLASAVAAVP
jgi:hypothetical protein